MEEKYSFIMTQQWAIGLPALYWLPGYRREYLLPDLLAGRAIWRVMVPEAMAYAGIVGVVSLATGEAPPRP